MTVDLFQGDCREVLASLPANMAHCCVTSPPYFAKRDYGSGPLEIGKEESLAEFIDNLVAVFRQVRRVLRHDGTLWLNIGDTYAGSWGRQGQGETLTRLSGYQREAAGVVNARAGSLRHPGVKPKDLYGVPWRLAFALQAGFAACSGCGVERRGDLWPEWNGHRVCVDCVAAGRIEAKVKTTEKGWYLRQDLIWAKPDPMPESVTDRCTTAHEYVFLLTKSEAYRFDAEAIAEPSVWGPDSGRAEVAKGGFNSKYAGADGARRGDEAFRAIRETRNKRSVWTVTTARYAGDHHAVMPTELAELCIKAGSPRGGLVLDPFGGAGTTGLACERLGRDAILVELNPANCTQASERIRAEAPVLTSVNSVEAAL